MYFKLNHTNEQVTEGYIMSSTYNDCAINSKKSFLSSSQTKCYFLKLLYDKTNKTI